MRGKDIEARSGSYNNHGPMYVWAHDDQLGREKDAGKEKDEIYVKLRRDYGSAEREVPRGASASNAHRRKGKEGGDIPASTLQSHL